MGVEGVCIGAGECMAVCAVRVCTTAGVAGGHMVLGVCSSTAHMLAKDVVAARCLSTTNGPFDYNAACDMGTSSWVFLWMIKGAILLVVLMCYQVS